MKFLNFILVLVFSFGAFAQSLTRPVYPVSVSVKTASYTIPANRWARVYVECWNGGIFTINGSTAMDTDDIQSLSSANTSSLAVSVTAPSGYFFIGQVFANSAGTGYVGSSSYVWPGAVASPGLVSVGPGVSVGVSSYSGAKSVYGFAYPANSTSKSTSFKLPPGTVINGSGSWQATVEEYIP